MHNHFFYMRSPSYADTIVRKQHKVCRRVFTTRCAVIFPRASQRITGSLQGTCYSLMRINRCCVLRAEHLLLLRHARPTHVRGGRVRSLLGSRPGRAHQDATQSAPTIRARLQDHPPDAVTSGVYVSPPRGCKIVSQSASLFQYVLNYSYAASERARIRKSCRTPSSSRSSACLRTRWGTVTLS
jgi:hypothetical protein